MPFGPFSAVYVDESIHESSGYILTGFVFDPGGMEVSIAEALIKAGLTPGVDEFKSGDRVEGDTSRQDLRQALLGLVRPPIRIAVLFSPWKERERLADDILACLDQMMRKNGLPSAGMEAFFDEGLFVSTKKASALAAQYKSLDGMTKHFKCDSRAVLGLQAADLVAHSISQVLRYNLPNASKTVLFENQNAPEVTRISLETLLLMKLRWAFLHQPQVLAEQRHLWGPETDPLIIPVFYLALEYAKWVRLLGWGVFVAGMLPPEVLAAIEARLTNLPRVIAWSPFEG